MLPKDDVKEIFTRVYICKKGKPSYISKMAKEKIKALCKSELKNKSFIKRKSEREENAMKVLHVALLLTC